MRKDLYLPTGTAVRLYEAAVKLPIVDYHCHLSPKEIWEDVPFQSIADMWLSGDHYKWRLMRQFGVDERCITGSASGREKFLEYVRCVSLAAGNPLKVWSEMELSLCFGIDTPLNEDTAEEIWEQTNAVISKEALSPRKLMSRFGVEAAVTTDDPADSLEYHALLRENAGPRVTPGFRPDKLLSLRAPGWREYMASLSARAEVEICGLSSLEEAVRRRLDAFCALGCAFSDVGIEDFPSGSCDGAEADRILRSALSGERVTAGEYRRFLRYMYVFLAGEYRRRGIVMQYHLAVRRNVNTALYQALGADAGGDCVGDVIPQEDLLGLLDEINRTSGLPRTILYTLNPAMYLPLVTAAGSFPGVTLGAAWWFNDHKAGIEEQLRIYAQNLHLAAFSGMLTDSRSFLSYARHDYFRRIFCGLLGEWAEAGELSEEAALVLVRRVCYENSRALTVRPAQP